MKSRENGGVKRDLEGGISVRKEEAKVHEGLKKGTRSVMGP